MLYSYSLHIFDDDIRLLLVGVGAGRGRSSSDTPRVAPAQTRIPTSCKSTFHIPKCLKSTHLVSMSLKCVMQYVIPEGVFCLLYTTELILPASVPALLFFTLPDLFRPRSEPVLSLSDRSGAASLSPCSWRQSLTVPPSLLWVFLVPAVLEFILNSQSLKALLLWSHWAWSHWREATAESRVAGLQTAVLRLTGRKGER